MVGMICPSTEGATEQDLCCGFGGFYVRLFILCQLCALSEFAQDQMSKTGRGQEGEGRGLWQNLFTTTYTALEAVHEVRRAPSNRGRVDLPSAMKKQVTFHPQSSFFLSC